MRDVNRQILKMEKRNFLVVNALNNVRGFFKKFKLLLFHCTIIDIVLFDLFSITEISTDTIEAVSGYCDSNCKSFLIFMSLFSFLVFMHSTSEVGSMLLIMRCTDPKGELISNMY